MSSRAKKVGQNVREKQSRMYMDSMYELFSLSLFQLLSLRHRYLKHTRKRRREQKLLMREIQRRYKHGRK